MAAEWAASAASNTVGNLATECVSPYINYFFRFGRNVEELKNVREKLKSKKERLQDGVDEAVRQTEVIYEDVKRWLTRAEEELRETRNLEDEIECNKCFNWCPSWGWRYCLSLKVAKKSICIKQLIDTCNFERLGQRPPLQGIEFLPSKDFKASQSSTVAFNAIIKALTTEGVNMIGLYGMPGVGKTTLAKQVGKYAREQKLFDNVVMVTISQTPSISKVQDRIAEILGLRFEANTEEGKAEELWRRFKGKKILIIIDDVWKEFELETIGSPNDVENEGCKILLTTRLQQVCIQMNCLEKFKLEILAEDEAWALFKENAGIEDLCPIKLIEVAKDLSRECKGLPLAIITVAKALKGRTLNAWETAKRRLKDSSHLDNQEVVGNIYSCLMLSYDYLKGDNTKSCFMLCSLFPEDYDIPIDRLILIGIGEGLFYNIESMEEQRKEIHQALQDLQQSGLLFEIDNEENTVRMHDVVRDFAHWLTSKRDVKFMVRDELTKWSMSENLESHTAIALWNFSVNSFPGKLDFKKLKTLILCGDGHDLLTIPTTFFKGLKVLRVLWLEDVKFSLKALQFLTNLRALLLVDCKLTNKNISSLINMKNLEILYVNGVGIDELYEELGILRHLKYLCFIQDVKLPSNLVSRLTSLQELHLLGENNINLGELSSLSCLSALSLQVSPDHDQSFEEDFVFPKLQSYNIVVNNELIRGMMGQTLCILEIRAFSSSLSPFKELFHNMEKLILSNVSGSRYVVSKEEAGGLNRLSSLKLVDCKDLEYLVEPTQNQANANTSLQSLKDVQVEWCRKLKSIFSPCVAHSLLHLQQFSVSHCNELEQVFHFAEYEEIVEQDDELPVLSNLTNLNLEFLPKVRCIWRKPTYRVNLSSLHTLEIWYCGKLECLFPSSLAQTLVHLEHVSLTHCESLIHLISAEAENGEAFSWPKLNTMKIKECERLKDVFSFSLINGLPSLKSIEIVSCPGLMRLFSVAKQNDELPPHLQFLESQSFINFINFSPGDYFAILPSLIKFKVVHKNYRFLYCAEKQKGIWLDQFNLQDDKLYKFERLICGAEHVELLRVINDKNLVHNLNKMISIRIEGGKEVECLIDALILSNLRELELSFLPELKCLWKGSTNNDNFQGLKVVKIRECNGLKYAFPSTIAQSLVQLEKLSIFYCDQIEYIVSKSENDGELGSHNSHDLSPFLPSLHDLCLDNLMNLKCLWKGPIHKDSLQSLKVLNITKCNGLKCVFPSTIAQSLVQLQQLHVVDCDQLEHIFLESESNAEIETHSGLDICHFLPSLQDLNLDNLMNLRCLWIGTTFKDSLQSLKVVNITKCSGLKYVFPSSLAQCLVQLQQLLVADCNQLEHIISESESDTEIGSHSDHDFRPILPDLQDLHLNNLMNLSGFSSENSPITLPFLNKLAVESCPRLVNFSIQKKVNEQVGLKELKFSKSGYDMINLNQPKQNSKNVDYATILEIFEIQNAELLSKIEFIKLDQMHQLLGPMHIAGLHFLRKLEVWKCNGLKSLFSPMLAWNLPLLFLLKIMKCKELEEIIDTTSSSSSQAEADSEACLPHIYFPNLELIKIVECNNLTSLFHVSVIPSLSKLKDIEIREATKLEQVFKYEAEVDINQDDQNHKRKIVLPPSLKRFRLLRVPGLRSLAPMGCHFLFPSTCFIRITGFSNSHFLTSFSMDSKKVVHAITQAQPPTQLHNDMEGDYDTKIDIDDWKDLPPYKEEEEIEVVDG